jgi:hypothetical protein
MLFRFPDRTPSALTANIELLEDITTINPLLTLYYSHGKMDEVLYFRPERPGEMGVFIRLLRK